MMKRPQRHGTVGHGLQDMGLGLQLCCITLLLYMHGCITLHCDMQRMDEPPCRDTDCTTGRRLHNSVHVHNRRVHQLHNRVQPGVQQWILSSCGLAPHSKK